MTNLANLYQQAITGGAINDDPCQREILVYLQRLADELQAHKPSWFHWRRKPNIKGLYIYGSVGVGKTFLMDFFYQHIDERKKARYHFHHFMQQIDAKLRKLQGQKDPLRLVAKHLARSVRLLCFDEFFVHDVAYAMILAELLQALMNEGVIIVFSSNTQPDNLYLNGVQRSRFLPVIAMIKKNCEVLFLDQNRDYRLGRAPLINAYLYPLNEKNQALMQEQFALMAGDIQEKGVISIQNREIPFLKRGAKAIWFDFAVLCNFPRSQLDYIELAQQFDIVFLSEIPVLTENHTAQTLMFINLIDVFYDQKIKLIVSAADSVEKLYIKGELKTTFQRTLSRLQEMQSIDYLN
ncbi:MAG: cell division protein ZapE [Legionella sp.]|jgi:cell division protein ZapE